MSNDFSIARSFVACNGADLMAHFPQSMPNERLILEYRDGVAIPRNLNIHLPKFVGDLNYLPPRMLDLLEIVSYVYGADRHTYRGSKNDVEYHQWSREYHFAVRVRDYNFWQQPNVAEALNNLLSFLSGNVCFRFVFEPGHTTPQANLFDTKEFALARNTNAHVILYSGGLDSLAGVLEELDHTDRDLYLVSHRSGQPATSKTQDCLLEALRRPDHTRPNLRAAERLKHYCFGCSLKGERAREETQRTRFFLYTAIAFVLSDLIGLDAITVYENGITSLNFPKRQDLVHSRATRTTHPRTIAALQNFFTMVAGRTFRVETPFFWYTKTDILQSIANLNRHDLISSSVSCSKTFKVGGNAGTHCGGCSQCVDRRFATWAAGLQNNVEGGIYATDFLTERVTDGDMRTTIKDYVRQAKDFTTHSLDGFYTNRANELAEICEYLDDMNEEEAIERLWKLSQQHGEQVKIAVERIRVAHDDPFTTPKIDSFPDMLRQRNYLKEEDMTEDIINHPAVEVFFSYSHVDESLRDELAKSLKLLERQKIISRWHDRRIGAGQEWKGEIDVHLNSAAIILLLVSADFLNSDYCYDVEMKRAMERHDSGAARVIPVILRECDWQIGDFAKLQALPTDGKAVTSRHWHTSDEAFTVVAKGIRTAVEEWCNRI